MCNHALILCAAPYIYDMAESLEYQTLVPMSKQVSHCFTTRSAGRGRCAYLQRAHSTVCSVRDVGVGEERRKVKELVECIFNKVELSSDSYHSFIDAFTECGWLDDLIGILNAAHRKYSDIINMYYCSGSAYITVSVSHSYSIKNWLDTILALSVLILFTLLLMLYTLTRA